MEETPTHVQLIRIRARETPFAASITQLGRRRPSPVQTRFAPYLTLPAGLLTRSDPYPRNSTISHITPTNKTACGTDKNQQIEPSQLGGKHGEGWEVDDAGVACSVGWEGVVVVMVGVGIAMGSIGRPSPFRIPSGASAATLRSGGGIDVAAPLMWGWVVGVVVVTTSPKRSDECAGDALCCEFVRGEIRPFYRPGPSAATRPRSQGTERERGEGHRPASPSGGHSYCRDRDSRSGRGATRA